MESTILLVDDESALLDSLGRYLEKIGYVVFREENGRDAVNRYRASYPDLVLLDLRLPDMTGFDVLEELREFDPSVIVMTGHGDVETAVKAMQLGAENFLQKPVDMPHLVVAVERALDKVRLRREVRLLKARSTRAMDVSALGPSPVMRELASQIELLAASERTTVLLTGESGTGKGFVAQMIHQLSPRSTGPFVDINCGGLTANFLDSELFGHEKGAFTDAKERKQGLFELADGGSILLDEIGDLAGELQPKLLKVLESKKFRRIGGTREISVDVRLIAATNHELAKAVEGGDFREDLFYRLNVLPLHLPAVRDREHEDRMQLMQLLLADVSRAMPGAPTDISSDAIARLLEYRWPGNVREMRNVLERALILAGGKTRVGVEHLPSEIRGNRRVSTGRHEAVSMRDMEHRHIERTLRHHKNNRTHAARELGVSRATLIKKIKEYNLE